MAFHLSWVVGIGITSFILQFLNKPFILSKYESSQNLLTRPPLRLCSLSPSLLGRNMLTALLLIVDGICNNSLDVEMMHHQTVQHNLSFSNLSFRVAGKA